MSSGWLWWELAKSSRLHFSPRISAPSHCSPGLTAAVLSARQAFLYSLIAVLLVGPLAAQQPRNYRVFSLRGKVVWFAEALERKHGVKSVPESQQRILALETGAGVLHPLVEDKRGRSFRRDPRLRGIPVELLVRQHVGSPLVQVIKIFALQDDQRYELDYWCEICAIAMFELKACDCCQGPIELRRRKAP